MGQSPQPGQLVDHYEVPVLEDLVVEEPATVGEDDRPIVLPTMTVKAALAEMGS
jgi:hypothetical protein